MKREALLGSLTEAASILYRSGMPLTNAVDAALDQYRAYYDKFERTVLYRQICRELGHRGGKRAQALAVVRRNPQLSFAFSPPKKS